MFALGISNNNPSFHNLVHFVVFHQTSDLVVIIVNDIKVFVSISSCLRLDYKD